jgi:hypothetical protein
MAGDGLMAAASSNTRIHSQHDSGKKEQTLGNDCSGVHLLRNGVFGAVG